MVLAHLYVGALVLGRISGLIIAMPGLSMRIMPNMVRIILILLPFSFRSTSVLLPLCKRNKKALRDFSPQIMGASALLPFCFRYAGEITTK